MYELVELEIMNIFSNTSFFPSSPEKAQGQKTKNVLSDVGELKRKIRDWSFGIPKMVIRVKLKHLDVHFSLFRRYSKIVLKI